MTIYAEIKAYLADIPKSYQYRTQPLVHVLHERLIECIDIIERLTAERDSLHSVIKELNFRIETITAERNAALDQIDRLRAMYKFVDPCHSCAYIQHIDGCPDENCNHGNGFIDWRMKE